MKLEVRLFFAFVCYWSRRAHFLTSPDLDSLASAIGWAWHASNATSQVVPLFQTPRADLHLRAENLHALELAGISAECSELLCIDDIPTQSDEAAPFPSTSFALVDHNRLHPNFARANPTARVVAIVDHHVDEGAHLDAAPRVVQVPTGSAASLVARVIAEESTVDIPRELATLLLCAILVDTNGLKEGGKAEDADRASAAYLFPRSLLVDQGTVTELQADAPLHEASSIQNLAKTLQEKKADISHLGTRDLLRRDYKEYSMVPSWAASSEPVVVGLSTVPLGLKSWIPKDPQFWSETETWMRERGLGVLGILTTFRDADKSKGHGKGKHRREQLFVVRAGACEGLPERLFDGLQRSEELNLKARDFVEDYGAEKDVGFGEGFEARVWKQGNVDATRKVTAPAVKAIIEGSGSA